MKSYICDSCGKIIKNPYKQKMIEYYLHADIDIIGDEVVCLPKKSKRKIKVHLCRQCVKSVLNILNEEERGETSDE